MRDVLTRELAGRTVPVPGTDVFDPTHTRIEAVARGGFDVLVSEVFEIEIEAQLAGQQ